MNTCVPPFIVSLLGLAACETQGSDLGEHYHQDADCSDVLVCEMDENGVHGECAEEPQD